jgi:hypothetical protein
MNDCGEFAPFSEEKRINLVMMTFLLSSHNQNGFTVRYYLGSEVDFWLIK